ncbi:hypothetical protein L6R52_07615 [Myxococcota bacterium]|nr:hypothetical protein [Myxococcota bacterium]
MTRTTRNLRTLAGGLFVLTALASGLFTHVGAAPRPEAPSAKAHERTRFSGLTSEVWRHGRSFEARDLAPVPNNNPYPEPQPHRDRPERLAFSADRSKVYVTLAGTEAEPGHEVAVVDLRQERVIGRVRVGRRPYTAVLHPGGRFLVVVNELSNYLTVIDTHTDEAVGQVAVDYYCQGLVFSRDGRRAWVANRYLDQVLVLDVRELDGRLEARVRPVGGFDEAEFFGRGELDPVLTRELEARGYSQAEAAEAARGLGAGGINGILRARCGACHAHETGGFVSGPDPVENFLSAVENAVGGQPEASVLLRAVIPAALGGFGDQRRTHEVHAGGALFTAGEPELERLVAWIRAADGGPGIPVGDSMAHPKDLVLSPDERHLFVANTGTMDVAVVDVEAERLVGAIFVGNVGMHLAVVPDPTHGRHQLAILTMGAGFGAPKARDPHGAETWDRDHAAAQFTILRDPKTTDPLPLEAQHVMGPFDAVDGTWNTKMKDIQNDLVAVDLSRLAIPEWRPDLALEHLVDTARYDSSEPWVRYTSDTAEALSTDVKGDIPPELQRVVGAFFEWAAVDGDSLFTTMAGTFELVEWKVRPEREAFARFEPVRVFDTGLRPVGVAVSPAHLVVANTLGESLTIIDRATGTARELVVGDLTRPPLDTDAEKGELVVHTSVFASDGDVSCLHCHYRDTGDGRGWGAAETIGQDRSGFIVHGGTLGIPAMRNTYAIQPYYFEGTHMLSEGQGADINEPAAAEDFDRPIWAGDFTDVESPVPLAERHPRHEELKERVTVKKLGPEGYTLDERRNAFIRQQSLRYFGAAYDLFDLYRFVGAWLGSNNHLLPSPYDREHPSVRRGEQLFEDPGVMCSVCHTRPELTNKSTKLAPNPTRALPQLTTVTRRDASYTLASVRAVEHANGEGHAQDMAPDDRGRVEGAEGGFTTMQLRGIFDRPPVFLHHGRARSLREALATPSHPGLRRRRFPARMGPEEVRPDREEVGFNELTVRGADGRLRLDEQIFDTHGGTSHLSARQLDDLVHFLLSVN